MMYLDVTGGCTLPLQSGIPRTTREIHRLARTHLREITTVRWQPFRRTYTCLSPRALAILEKPEAPLRPPRDTTGPHLVAALRDLAAWPAAVKLQHELGEKDTLVLTSLFPDNRLDYIERLGRGKRIAFFHDAIPLRDPNVPAWERKHHLRALRLLSTFDLVIAVSGASRDDLLALTNENGLPAPSIRVLPWPAPFDQLRPDFAPPSVRKSVLYVSRLKQVKNHAALLTACEMLWSEGLDFSLELIGCEDEPRESATVLREIQRLQEKGRPIQWRAQVSEEELHAAYRACAFTVFPSRREGFGLPILESFWHGRGVICSDRDAMGEISSGPGAVQIDVERPEAIATIMRRLLTDGAACLALAREAHGRPLRNWDDYWRELQPMLAS